MENNYYENEPEQFASSPYGEKPKKKKSFARGVLTGALSVSVIFAILTCIFFKVAYHDLSDVLDAETEKKLNEVYSVISEYYYKDADLNDLSTGTVKGMVEGLKDPYSVYYTAEEYEDFIIDATGSYAGIGAVLSKDQTTGSVSVINVYEGSPAEEAGLKKGDIIVSADGHEGTEEELSVFVQSIRGEEGTDVKLEVYRDGKTLEIVCTRRAIQVPSVKYQMLKDEAGNEDIGYIQISEFSEGTYDEFVKALTDLQDQGMKAVIYDVRSNPGGMLQTVTDMLDYILPAGTTVYMLDNQENKTEYTSDDKQALDLPTVVLVNGESASASEIFSGAVRDFKYGTLIGTTTYGKGVVQNTIPFSDGSALKLTIATYYTPSGECIHEKGITPDIELEYEYTGDEEGDYDYYADNQVVEGIKELTKKISE